MTMFGSQWLGNAGSTYEIDQSIRFNDNDSPYLTRTPGSGATDNRKFTVSMWLKRTTLTVDHVLFSTPTGNGRTQTYFDDSDKLNFGFYDGADNRSLVTNMQFRDTAAWYHVVWSFDIDNGTAASRLRLYVNGSEADGTRNNPNTGVDSLWMNNGDVNDIGRQNPSTNAYFDGYMAEIHSIDGQALNGTSFGETNNDGVWIPKKYSGAYGTNGFFIDGRDSSDLGDDESGNGNDFTSSGLAANDQMSDSPTNNWCIMNSLDAVGPTLSNGNLGFTDSNGSAWRTARATMVIPSTGKWYWECIATSSGGVGDPNFGIVADSVNTQVSDWYQDALAYAYSTRYDSVVNNNWTGTSRGTYAGGNVLQIAYDSGTGKLHFGIQNSWINGGDPADGSSPDFTTSTTLTFLPYVAIYNNKTGSINFGQSAFAYTPPTGFEALNSSNAPDPAIANPSDYFTSFTYTGDDSGTSRAFTGIGFAPNLVWTKARGATYSHALFDTVRGVEKYLSSDGTGAEINQPSSGYITAFGSDGYTFADGSSGTNPRANYNADTTYVSWNWVEGSTPGFDIVSYTGTGANRTVAHNLGVKPGMFIVKQRGASGSNWGVYHSGVGATKSLFLQSTEAAFDSDEYFNDTEPTSSVFTLGVNAQGNADGGTYIAYVFAPVEGFSAFGAYEGNGNANGAIINVGFTPSWVMIKKSDGANDWNIQDTKRSPFNVSSAYLYSNTNAAESTFGSGGIDIVSNGFKIRTTANVVNTSGSTYVYAAFAHSPFKTTNAR